jgi:hypothetical protein
MNIYVTKIYHEYLVKSLWLKNSQKNLAKLYSRAYCKFIILITKSCKLFLSSLNLKIEASIAYTLLSAFLNFALQSSMMYRNPTSHSLSYYFLPYICFNRPLTIVFKSCLSSSSLSIVFIFSKVAGKFKLSVIYASLNTIVFESIMQPHLEKIRSS